MLNRLRRRGFGQASCLDYRAATHLHCMVSSLGYERRAGGEAYDWRGLERGSAPFGLMQFTMAGSGRLRWQDREFSLQPGHLMLLEIPHDHRYWLPVGGNWELCYLCLVGREALRLWHEICRDLGPVLDLTDLPALMRQIEELIVAGLRDERQVYQLSAKTYEVVMALLAHRDRQRYGVTLPKDVRDALEYGERHFAEAIRVDDLAREAGVSRFHFSRRFREQVGISPGAWLRRLRATRAAELLTTSDVGLTEIAHRCGFADANYFGKVFRKAYGVSPGVFRRSGMY